MGLGVEKVNKRMSRDGIKKATKLQKSWDWKKLKQFTLSQWKCKSDLFKKEWTWKKQT